MCVSKKESCNDEYMDECFICLEDMNSNSHKSFPFCCFGTKNIRTISLGCCDKKLHLSCYKTWIKKNTNSCPWCGINLKI